MWFGGMGVGRVELNQISDPSPLPGISNPFDPSPLEANEVSENFLGFGLRCYA